MDKIFFKEKKEGFGLSKFSRRSYYLDFSGKRKRINTEITTSAVSGLGLNNHKQFEHNQKRIYWEK